LSFQSFLDTRLFPTSLSLRLPWYLIFPAQRNIIITDCTVAAGHDWVVEGVFYLSMSLERVQVDQGGVRAAANNCGRGLPVSG
jgi:hypothetical protein